MLTPYADVKFRLCVHELSIYLSLTAPGKPFLFAMSTIAVESDIAHAFTFIHVTGLLLSSSTIRYLPVFWRYRDGIRKDRASATRPPLSP